MNKQKDAVQEAIEALDKLIRNAPMIKRGQRPENHRLQMAGWLCKVSVAIKEERAALKSSPVDVEELKKNGALKKYTLGSQDPLARVYLKGWNDCLDHLIQNGYRITKEG